MPCLFVLLCRRIALSFESFDMNDNRLVAVLYTLKCLDQHLHIVALINVHIIQSHCAEQIAFCLSLCVAQKLQIAV